MTFRSVLLAALALWFAVPAAAQEDRIPQGVRLGFIYQTGYRPKLAVRPVEASGVGAGVAETVYDILQRDLDYSDRFEMATTPVRLAAGAVDYPAWNELGVVYLVTGEVQPMGGGVLLRTTLHDVVYGRVKDARAFELPAPGSEGFRMAVHAVSDEIVRWATGQAGMAASRIVFRRKSASGNELMIVDSDGENLRRLASAPYLFPGSWSPTGDAVLYTTTEDATAWRILAHDLDGGRARVVTEGGGLLMTPAFSADGRRIAFGRQTPGGIRIFTYDVAERCCLTQLTQGPRDDVSPSFSPDGRRIAFNSGRLGQPHIYVQSLDGGEATLLSPFVYGQPGYYTSPDWSPTGSLITFHGRSRGEHQIMVADAARPGATVQQITADGSSEDPSWAPDGRHIVFSGYRSGQGWGLYVVDAVTGRLRPIVTGYKAELPDWSPSLARASALAGVPR